MGGIPEIGRAIRRTPYACGHLMKKASTDRGGAWGERKHRTDKKKIARRGVLKRHYSS